MQCAVVGSKPTTFAPCCHKPVRRLNKNCRGALTWPCACFSSEGDSFDVCCHSTQRQRQLHVVYTVLVLSTLTDKNLRVQGATGKVSRARTVQRTTSHKLAKRSPGYTVPLGTTPMMGRQDTSEVKPLVMMLYKRLYLFLRGALCVTKHTTSYCILSTLSTFLSRTPTGISSLISQA